VDRLEADAADHDEDDVDAGTHLWDAVAIIVIADAVMSSTMSSRSPPRAKGDLDGLLIIGLAISVPLVSTAPPCLMKLIERFPPIGRRARADRLYRRRRSGDDPGARALDRREAARWLAWIAPTLCTLAVVAGRVAPHRRRGAGWERWRRRPGRHAGRRRGRVPVARARRVLVWPRC